MNEFELIRRYFSFSSGALSAPDLGIGDDCALLSVPSNCQLAVSTDTLVSGVHFPVDGSPERIGRRALRVNLSDLAAMGAAPLGFQLALSLPSLSQVWLQQFSEGLAKDAGSYDCPLVGGDTTRGPLAITITVLGVVEKGRALQRSGARLGDSIFVTGTLGDSAGGLRCLEAEVASDFLLNRYWLPSPRVAMASVLQGFATAAVDISDGLLQDLGHILTASSQPGVVSLGARVELEALPLSTEALGCFGEKRARENALFGGDDYELCFTVPAEKEEAFLREIQSMKVVVSRIGSIIDSSPEVQVVNAAGDVLTIERKGYDHFR